MSDLANFVAASIRDQVVEGLNEEVQNLNEEVRQLKARNAELQKNSRTVSVTGPGGSVVYATAQVDLDGLESRTVGGDSIWVVALGEPQQPDRASGSIHDGGSSSSSAAPRCSWRDLVNLELRIADNGHKLRNSEVCVCSRDDYDDERGSLKIGISLFRYDDYDGIWTYVNAFLGPLTRQQCAALETYLDDRQEFRHFRDGVERVAGNSADRLAVDFDDVCFHNYAHTVWHAFKEGTDGEDDQLMDETDD